MKLDLSRTAAPDEFCPHRDNSPGVTIDSEPRLHRGGGREPMMRGLLIVAGLGAGLALGVGSAEAQYRYTDDKGIIQTKQYKVDVPDRYRDAAVWIGPVGVGKPALSEEQRQVQQRWDAYRRIGELNEKRQREAAERARQLQNRDRELQNRDR